jgi:hypothetical protein
MISGVGVWMTAFLQAACEYVTKDEQPGYLPWVDKPSLPSGGMRLECLQWKRDGVSLFGSAINFIPVFCFSLSNSSTPSSLSSSCSTASFLSSCSP